jgi:hypothetical protein
MARRLGPDLDAGEPGFPTGKLAIWRDWLGPPNGDAGLTGAYKSPGSAWPGVNVKMPIGIVLQAADGSVPAKEGQHRAHVAPDAEIDGIACQMTRARGAANAGVAMPAAAR